MRHHASGEKPPRVGSASVIADDGSFHHEEPLAEKLKVRRGHVHQTPLYKHFVYSVGGRANNGNTLGTIASGL